MVLGSWEVLLRSWQLDLLELRKSYMSHVVEIILSHDRVDNVKNRNSNITDINIIDYP